MSKEERFVSHSRTRLSKIHFCRRSWLTGRFRILLDDSDFREMAVGKVKLKFKGRVQDERAYSIKDVKMALRQGNTLNVDPSCNVDVTFNGSNEAEVKVDGLMSDVIELP